MTTKKKQKENKEDSAPFSLTASEQKLVTATIQELVTLLGIEGTFECNFTPDAVEVVLSTTDTGMVIGYHGEILDSLALVFSLCIAKKLGRFVHVFVDVGDYRKNRIDYLHQLAEQTKEKVLTEQREFTLSELKSWERRVIHLYLQEDSEVMSESVGEGKERILIVKPRA